MFYDGRNPVFGTPKPAKLLIRGVADMKAILSLSSHSTVNPFVVDLVSDGLNNIFKIRNAWTKVDYLSILRDSGNVGIGTSSPERSIQRALIRDIIGSLWSKRQLCIINI